MKIIKFVKQIFLKVVFKEVFLIEIYKMNDYN